MKIRIIDEGNCEITFDIKFGQKRKGWVRFKLISVPEYQNSCPWCVMRRVCHDFSICSEIITQVIIKGHILFTPQQRYSYRLCGI